MILEFDGYGPGAPRVYVPAKNIIRFHLVDFNGNYGTHIDLPEGRHIRVGEWPEDVKKKLEQALAGGSE